MAEEGKKQRAILGLRGNALVVTVTELIIFCGESLTGAFWSLYVLSLGASIVELGLFSLVTGLMPAVIIGPLGYLGDRISRKKLIIVGDLISGLGPLMNVFPTYWMWLIPGSLAGSLAMATMPARQATVAGEIRPQERGRVFATRNTIMMLPQTFMPTIAGIVLDSLGFEIGMRYILLVNAGMRFLAVGMLLRFLKERNDPPRANPTLRLSTTTVKGGISEMFRPILSIKMLSVMMTANIISNFSMGMMMRFQSVYMVEVVGLTKTEWGLITGGVSVLQALLRIPLGGLTDRWGRRRCILINYCLQPPIIFSLALARNFFTIFSLMAARTVAMNVGMSAWEAMIADITPSNVRGSVYGSMGTIQHFTQSLSPMFGSAVWDTISPGWIFYFSALFRASSAIVLLKFLKEPENREE